MNRTVKELFQFHSGSGVLTERAIYEHQSESANDAVAVYSGATDDENNLPVCSKRLVTDACAPLVHGYGILVARKGQAGSMRIINGTFTFNDNAYAMTLKRGAADLVDPLFFTIAYQDAFFDLVTSKDGNGTFAKGVAENLTIWLPPIEMQRDIAKAWRKHEGMKGRLMGLRGRVQTLLKQPARAEYEFGFKTGVLMSHFQGRQITDKELYDTVGTVPVISGANAEVKGYSNTPLVEPHELPCITYQTKGNTDVLVHIQDKQFDANNTAVMSIKSRWRDDIDLEFMKMPLRWKMKQLQTSGESVSYIDTRILTAELQIPVLRATTQPDIAEQRRIAAEYRRLQDIETKLQTLIAGSATTMDRLRQLAVSIVDENGLAKAVNALSA